MINSFMLLAEDPIYVQMGRNFREGSSTNRTLEIGIFTVVLAVIITLMWFINRRMEKYKEMQKTSPDALFSVLCKAHRLKRSERRYLRAFAKSRELPHPAMVFVAPERMSDQALGDLDERKRDRLISIRERLFEAEVAA